MFSFFNEFLNDITIANKNSLKLNGYKYINFNGEIFYFENFKDILLISNNEIILKLTSGELSILGDNLKITELSKNFLSLTGKVNKVEVKNV